MVYFKAVTKQVFSQDREHWQPLIEGMYRRFNPAKLADIDKILQKYKGEESTLFKELCKKYITTLSEGDPQVVLCDWGERAADTEPEAESSGSEDGDEEESDSSPSSESCSKEAPSPKRQVSERRVETPPAGAAKTPVRDRGTRRSPASRPRSARRHREESRRQRDRPRQGAEAHREADRRSRRYSRRAPRRSEERLRAKLCPREEARPQGQRGDREGAARRDRSGAAERSQRLHIRRRLNSNLSDRLLRPDLGLRIQRLNDRLQGAKRAGDQQRQRSRSTEGRPSNGPRSPAPDSPRDLKPREEANGSEEKRSPEEELSTNKGNVRSPSRQKESNGLLIASCEALNAFVSAAPRVDAFVSDSTTSLDVQVEFGGKVIPFRVPSSMTVGDLAHMYGQWMDTVSSHLAP